MGTAVLLGIAAVVDLLLTALYQPVWTGAMHGPRLHPGLDRLRLARVLALVVGLTAAAGAIFLR